MNYQERKIKYTSARSLVWQDNDLVDWVGGGVQFSADGSIQDSSVCYAGDFDAAVATSSGNIAIVYQRLGTKGIVLENQRVVREINRSYYHANVYEYPICLWEPAGQPPAIIHCPNEYNQLEIEDALSGKTLVSTKDRSSPDFFHSRLSISPSGRYLMSAGWVWHPMDIANIYLLPGSEEKADLDTPFAAIDTANEVSAAAWVDDTSVLAANSDNYEYEEGELFAPGSLGIWSLKSKQWSGVSVPDVKLGSVMMLDMEYIISFFGHPKLIRISDGVVLKEWPHIHSGEQSSSIIHHIDRLPPIAIDQENLRFAVANEDCIYVVSFEKSS